MKSKFLIFNIAIAGVLLLAVLTSGKGNNTKSKLGYINVVTLWQSMPEKQHADSVLLKMKSEFVSYMQQRQKKFEEEVIAFKRDSASMTALIKQEKLDALVKEQEALKKFPQQAESELKKKQEELYTPIRNKMQKAIDEVAAENNYDYITDTSIGHIIYAKNKEDNILPLVKKKLGIE